MDDKKAKFFEDVDSQEPSFEADEDFFKREEEKHRKFFEDESDEKDKDGDPTFFSAFSMSRSEVIEEVKKDGMFLSRVSGKYGDDFEVVCHAVENNGNALAYASKRIQADDEAAQFFVDTKKNSIINAEKSGQDPAVIVTIQQEIETINAVHVQAKRDLEKSNGQHQYISM